MTAEKFTPKADTDADQHELVLTRGDQLVKLEPYFGGMAPTWEVLTPTGDDRAPWRVVAAYEFFDYGDAVAHALELLHGKPVF